MPSRNTSDWGQLTPAGKQHLHSQGINAATYNRWWRMPQADRTALSIKARKSGYKDGLRFLATESAIRNRTPAGRTIKVTTPANQAAVTLISGTRGAANVQNRVLVSQLFDFEGFDRIDYQNFLSP